MNAQHKDVTLKIVEVLSKNNVILSDIDTIFSLVKRCYTKTTTVCDLYKKNNHNTNLAEESIAWALDSIMSGLIFIEYKLSLLDISSGDK